jgi:E3 ubiquitin-protein ligase RNF5
VPESPATDDEPAAGLPAQEDILPLLDLPMDDSPSSWRERPMDVFDWHDSDDAVDVGALAVASFGAPDSEEEMPPLPLAGLEGVRLEWVERLSHPDRAAPAAGAEMVSTGRSAEGAMEDTAPELRLQRLIQVSEQHRIVRPGPVNRSQRATSPEAERLAQAIQRSHSSLDVSRRQNLDGDGKMIAGMGAGKKDGNCGCSSSFECNICLDAAKEPVVTPCGHLFCWPCLYQWLHGHSAHSECPVCKGEVLDVNVTPIYGRGGGGERDASSIDVPPRPSANRSESLRQQLQMPDPRGIASMVRRLIENQDHLRGQAAPPTAGVEVALLPEGGRITRIVRRRVSPSLVSPSPLTRLVRRPAPHIGNQVQLPSSNSDNAAPAVPQQSSSVEQASTSSTVAVIVGEAAQSRRSRLPSESAPTRRTRRRQQH